MFHRELAPLERLMSLDTDNESKYTPISRFLNGSALLSYMGVVTLELYKKLIDIKTAELIQLKENAIIHPANYDHPVVIAGLDAYVEINKRLKLANTPEELVEFEWWLRERYYTEYYLELLAENSDESGQQCDSRKIALATFSAFQLALTNYATVATKDPMIKNSVAADETKRLKKHIPIIIENET